MRYIKHAPVSWRLASLTDHTEPKKRKVTGKEQKVKSDIAQKMLSNIVRGVSPEKGREYLVL